VNHPHVGTVVWMRTDRVGRPARAVVQGIAEGCIALSFTDRVDQLAFHDKGGVCRLLRPAAFDSAVERFGDPARKGKGGAR
jgi:hypothetical protein